MMMEPRPRQFVNYYIQLFTLLSKLGFLPVKWSDSQSKFLQADFLPFALFRTFHLLVGIEFLFLSMRLYWLLHWSPSYKMDDLIFLEVWLTFNIVSSGVFLILFYRLNTGIESLSSMISNLARLQELLNLSREDDPIRKSLSLYVLCYIPGLFLSAIAISYEFYNHPTRSNFLYSIIPGSEAGSLLLWTLFWIYELVQQYVFWGMAAFLGVYSQLLGRIAIHGMQMLSPDSKESGRGGRYIQEPGNVSFPQAVAWHNSYSVALGLGNQFLKHVVLSACILVTIGFCLAAYGILKVPDMSPLSYGLLLVVSNLNFWFPYLACMSLGRIPPSFKNFGDQWHLATNSKLNRRIIRSFRVTGILASGLWTMSLPMFLENADFSTNWIICVLVSY